MILSVLVISDLIVGGLLCPTWEPKRMLRATLKLNRKYVCVCVCTSFLWGTQHHPIGLTFCKAMESLCGSSSCSWKTSFMTRTPEFHDLQLAAPVHRMCILALGWRWPARAIHARKWDGWGQIRPCPHFFIYPNLFQTTGFCLFSTPGCRRPWSNILQFCHYVGQSKNVWDILRESKRISIQYEDYETTGVGCWMNIQAYQSYNCLFQRRIATCCKISPRGPRLFLAALQAA